MPLPDSLEHALSGELDHRTMGELDPGVVMREAQRLAIEATNYLGMWAESIIMRIQEAQDS